MPPATNHEGWEGQALSLSAGWVRVTKVFATKEEADQAVDKLKLLYPKGEFRSYESLKGFEQIPALLNPAFIVKK